MSIVIWAAFILLTLYFLYVVYCSIVGRSPLSDWQGVSRRQVAAPHTNPMPETLIPLQNPHKSEIDLYRAEIYRIERDRGC